MTLFVCWFQYITAHSSRGAYCTETYGVLWLERRWLDALIALQLGGGIARMAYKFFVFKKR